MSVRETIAATFESVAREQNRRLEKLTDHLKLLDSGLDSISFALIVMRLEDSFGYDPFDSETIVKFPVTFGDFVTLYDRDASAP